MFRTAAFIVARSALMAVPAAALSVCALAQTADSGHPSFYQLMLQKMDSNGDGRISLDEYLAAATARFKAIDTQNKGAIDAADIAAAPATLERDQKIAAAIVKRVDKDGKGYISQDDVVAAAKARFARMDKKGDGKLTPDELTAPGKHAHARFASADRFHGQSGNAAEARGVQAKVFRPHRHQPRRRDHTGRIHRRRDRAF